MEVCEPRLKASDNLARSMGLLGTLFITISCLSPSIAVFIVGSDVMRQVGSGVFLCFLAAALFGVAMACVYGELGSAFPGPGGEYTIIGRILGPTWGRGVLGLNLLGFSVSLALSGFAVATYLATLWPTLPVRAVAVAAVSIVTALAVLPIRIGALVTAAFLLIELATLGTLAAIGARNVEAPLSALFHPAIADVAGGLRTPTLAALGSGTAAGIYAFNGYGAAIFFGEDMREARRDVAPAVLLALLIGVVTVLPPIAFVILGAPDLRTLFLSSAPIASFVERLGGRGLADVMSIGVALAVFNTMIAIALMAGRQLYATGRDGLWPAAVNKILSASHNRWGSPMAATLTMGAGGLVGCIIDPHALLLILGNSNIVTYAGLCLASLCIRRTPYTSAWHMPFFPATPMLGMAFLLAVGTVDVFDPEGRRGFLVTAFTVGAALFLFARKRVSIKD